MTIPQLARADEDTRQITARVLAFELVSGLNDLYYSSAGEVVNQLLSAREFSAPLEMDIHQNILAFYSSIPEEGNPATPLAAVTIPPVMEDALLVFVPIDGISPAGHQYRILVLEDTVSAFPFGSKLIWNLSRYDLAGELGSGVFQVPARQQRVVTANGGRVSTENTRVQIRFAYNGGETGWKMLTSTRWTFRPDERTLIMVYFDEDSDRLRFKGVSDRLISTSQL